MKDSSPAILRSPPVAHLDAHLVLALGFPADRRVGCAVPRNSPALAGREHASAGPGMNVGPKLAAQHREAVIPFGAHLGHPPDRIRQWRRGEAGSGPHAPRACGRAARRRSAR